MKCENVQIYLPEYIDGKLDEKKSDKIKIHLEGCTECKQTYEEFHSFINFTNSLPEIEAPEGMKKEFMDMAELDGFDHKKRVLIPDWVKIAAVIVFTIGMFATGYFTGTKTDNSQNLQAELNLLKQEIIRAELVELSGAQKIQAVYNAQEVANPGTNLIDALVYTMNSDKNINVRLAAINALSDRIENQTVKNAMIESLAIQDNPLLQISLIQVLAGTGDEKATEKIQSFANDNNVDENVRSHAKEVIQALI